MLGHPVGTVDRSTHPGRPGTHPGVAVPVGRVGLAPGGVVIYSAAPGVALVTPPGRVYKLNGVGFKSFRRGGWVVFQLGYSHYVATRVGTRLVRPRRAALAVDPTAVTRVTHLRRPDPYKARGIHLDGTRPTLKQGKRR